MKDKEKNDKKFAHTYTRTDVNTNQRSSASGSLFYPNRFLQQCIVLIQPYFLWVAIWLQTIALRGQKTRSKNDPGVIAPFRSSIKRRRAIPEHFHRLDACMTQQMPDHGLEKPLSTRKRESNMVVVIRIYHRQTSSIVPTDARIGRR